MLSETMYNTHLEWMSFVFNNCAQPETGLFIKRLIPPAAAAVISARGQSKRVLYWL